jgi:hypothetical protein
MARPRLKLAALLGVVALTAWPTPGRADSVLAWNNELIDIFQQTSGLLIDTPPEVAREMSIVDSAMFDAANAASGTQYPSINYTGGAVSGASAEAAALSAGYTAMQGIFSNVIWQGNQTNSALTIGNQTVPANTLSTGFGGSASTQTTVLNEISNVYSSALSALGSDSSITAGLSLGVSAGNASLTANGYTVTGGAVNPHAYATDGSAAALLVGLQNNVPAGSGTVPGVYVPPASRPEMTPTWGTVNSVGGMTNSNALVGNNNIPSVVASVIPGPPTVGSAAYASALLLTECQGSSQPLSALPANVQSACAAAGYTQQDSAHAAAALFWNDPGTTFQPPGHWLQIADTVAQSQGLGLTQEARLTALVSQAENDAGIAAWEAKYKDWNGIGPLWRPATAIPTCGTGTASWNSAFTACDPTWTSLIATPPHPDYVAGHPAFSGAGAKMLESFFGTDNISFSSTSNSYCNGGGSNTVRSASDVTIVACTVGVTSGFAYSPEGGNSAYATSGGCTGAGGTFAGSGSAVSCTIGASTYHYYATIYSMNQTGVTSTAGCTDAGGILGTDSGLTTCTLGGLTYYYSPTVGGCNDVVTTAGANDSPLICPITETFDSFSAASNGTFGSEYSRIAGGIHTDFSVADALTLGTAIGTALAQDAGLPEPASLTLLGLSALGLGWVRRRRRSPAAV